MPQFPVGPCEIVQRNGLRFLVSSEDAEWVRRRQWGVDRYGYLKAVIYVGNYKKRTVLLHRLILGEPQGVVVDHKNGDRLDCRRENLRLSDWRGNARNRRKISGTSRYKGVTFHRGAGKWQAAIDRSHYLGLFASETDAALAYDRAARERHGEYARLNFPDEFSP